MSNIKDRATALSNRKCSIPGCDRPAQALAAPDSRATALCRKHLKHRARHGSAWRKSFTAEELDPYRKTASRWLTANRQAPMVQHVLTALAGMMANAGKAESAYDLNRVKPEKRAKIALARLREAKVAPETLLINAMAVWALFEAEDMDERMREFREVQIAKLAHRLASATRRTRTGLPMPAKYPPSAGLVLRHLGRMIDDKAALIAEPAARDVLAMVNGRESLVSEDGAAPVAAIGPHIQHAPGNQPPAIGTAGGPRSGSEGAASAASGDEGEEGEPSDTSQHEVPAHGQSIEPGLMVNHGAAVPRTERGRPPDAHHVAASCDAPAGGDDDDENIPPPPVLFHDPWLTAAGTALGDLVAFALSLPSEPSPKPLRPATAATDAQDRAAMIARLGRVRGNRHADLRRQMREAANAATPPRRTRKLKPAEAENRAAIISNIIANLALLHATGPASGARLAVDMAHSQRTRYDRPGFGLLPRMIDHLASAGLLIKHSAKFKRRRTTIEPSASLRASFDQGAINLGDIGRAEGEELIWLTTRTGKMGFAGKPSPKALVHYKDTDETRRLRAEMAEINRFLATASITLADAPQPAGCLTRRFILRTPDDPAAFNLGGRLFGGFWQNLPREERHRLRINGEPVADLDYSGMFPRLAYLAAGAPMPPPDADPYAIPGLESHRDGAKKALNALISRTGPMRNLKGDLKALLPTGMTAAKLTGAVNAHHS